MQVNVLSELQIYFNIPLPHPRIETLSTRLLPPSIEWFLRQWQWEVSSTGFLNVHKGKQRLYGYRKIPKHGQLLSHLFSVFHSIASASPPHLTLITLPPPQVVQVS